MLWIVEETEIYDELKKFKIDVSAFKKAGFVMNIKDVKQDRRKENWQGWRW